MSANEYQKNKNLQSQAWLKGLHFQVVIAQQNYVQ